MEDDKCLFKLKLMGLLRRSRWKNRLAQNSDYYGILPCMSYIIFWDVINTTTYPFGRHNLHLLLVNSSMTSHLKKVYWYITFPQPQWRRIGSETDHTKKFNYQMSSGTFPRKMRTLEMRSSQLQQEPNSMRSKCKLQMSLSSSFLWTNWVESLNHLLNEKARSFSAHILAIAFSLWLLLWNRQRALTVGEGSLYSWSPD